MKLFFRSLKNTVRTVGAMICTPAPQPSAHCTNINMLLMHLCDFNSEQYQYIVKWLAFQLKNPGSKMCYGLIASGDQGTGTTMFFEHIVVRLFEGMGSVIRAGELSDRFNSWGGAPLIVVNGAMTQLALARIKALISSPTVIINREGRQPMPIPNQMNFVFVTGHVDAIPAGIADRRFMVLRAPPAREQIFYQAVAAEIRNGGIEAFRDFLLRDVYLVGFNETTRPPGLDRAGAGERAAQEAA